jgi:hypothetical protein
MTAHTSADRQANRNIVMTFLLPYIYGRSLAYFFSVRGPTSAP